MRPGPTPGADETVTGPAGTESRQTSIDRGSVVGRYVVLHELGAGGVGVVYAAYDPELDRKVALKLLHGRPSNALLREAQAMAQLNHPNVITVHDVGEHEGRVFLAMEFVEGGTLTDWLKRNRSWREVLDVFRRAAHGLTAAHDKGLVHRDFKPDNVMVGADGRVRVMDLGLARPSEIGEHTKVREKPSASPRTDSVGSVLPREGLIVGTPAYMAPEQHMGGEVGPAADQFSFCVAMWEALFNTRPFAGETQGAIRTPPAGKSVPRWLQRVMRRGLAAEPERRYPSMRALVAELSRSQSKARLRRVLGGLAAATVAAAGVAGARRLDEATRIAACSAQGASFTEAWNDEIRARVRQGLLGAGASYASTTAERVLPHLDAHADQWKEARTDVCLRANVTREWDAETLDRSTWCLDDRRMRFEALVEALTHADERMLRNAITSADTLSRGRDCRDASELARMPALPEDREGLEAARRMSSQAAALSSAGHYEEALEAASEAIVAADALNWPPLAASARAQAGSLLEDLGRSKEAEAMLEDAYFSAAEHGALDVVVHACTSLVYTVGYRQARHDEGRSWARHLDLALDAMDEPDDGTQRASALSNLANIQLSEGDYVQANLLFARALEIDEKARGPWHPHVASALNNLANSHQQMGENDEAVALYLRALSIKERALGPDHPAIANSLANLGGVYFARGEYDNAEEAYQRALAIDESAFGPKHRYVAQDLSSLAEARTAVGDYDGARALGRRALSIREEVLGPSHPEVANSLTNLGTISFSMGDYEEALATHTRALALYEESLGPDHPNVASGLNNVGDTLTATGNHDEALAHYERALAIYESKLGLEHPRLAYSLSGLAHVALARRRLAEAVQFAERAASIREAAGVSPNELADSRFLLAQALWEASPGESTDRDRARRLIQQARATYAETQAGDASVVRIDAWIAEHP